jgi:uncharacterized repeat protein (TIGR01451 family)
MQSLTPFHPPRLLSVRAHGLLPLALLLIASFALAPAIGAAPSHWAVAAGDDRATLLPDEPLVWLQAEPSYLEKTHWYERVCPGWGQRYDIDVTNSSGITLTGMLIRDLLPPQTRFADTDDVNGKSTGGVYDLDRSATSCPGNSSA